MAVSDPLLVDQQAEASSLGHMPTGRWTFDESVTSVFSDMLRRSIPQYDIMRQSVFDIGVPYVKPGTSIVDLGCSRGDAIAPFIAQFGEANGYVGVEVSPSMLAAACERFKPEIASGLVTIDDLDLKSSYPYGAASVTLCILTLQFIPLEHRQRIVRDAFSNTVPGGAFILVEKILGATAELSEVMLMLYHRYKAAHGYTTDEIQRKQLSLEGVLVPVTAGWNEDLLAAAGFQEVDCFWRWMNFAAWVAVKR